MYNKPVALLICLLAIMQSYAQEKAPVQFGNVSLEDFNLSKFNVDTTNGAVIIADVGTSTFENNGKGSYRLIFKHQRRVKVIDKNGFDVASVKILLYANGDNKEVLDEVKAYTYNIENGKVVETKLKHDAIFDEEKDKKFSIESFTLPAVKEGSIIEYSYTIVSDFLFGLHPWEFQGKYPCLWSEYEADIPESRDYVTISQGYLPFYINTKTNDVETYSAVEPSYGSFGGNRFTIVHGKRIDNRWVMKDVPALKLENFTSSLNNHIAKIEFQLAGIRYNNGAYQQVMNDWPTVGKDLMDRADFGIELNDKNKWMNDSMQTIIAGASTDLDKARKIYYYVKNNIRCTNVNGIYMHKTLKDIFKDKSGSVGEVNMLLVAMLKHENINADPLILSTIDHGYTNEIYPLLDRYNYLVCKATIDTNNYFLDATQSCLGFGHLPLYCYNGHAMEIDKTPSPVYLLPDTLQETKFTSIFLSNDSSVKGKWTGNFTSALGYSESGNVRKKIMFKGKADVEKEIRSDYTDEYSVTSIEINNADSCEQPLVLNYGLDVDQGAKNDVIYFSPMMNEGYKENPLKAAERKYPVEMPYLVDETYNLSLEIPQGYEVDELPKSVRVNFNGDDAFFQYHVSSDGTNVNLVSHLKFMKAVFAPNDYQNLRDFFDYIVKKENEQIVFKKKK